MPKHKYDSGSEQAMMLKRKKLTEAGYPEYARTARDYTDPDQAIKTADFIRNIQEKNRKFW